LTCLPAERHEKVFQKRGFGEFVGGLLRRLESVTTLNAAKLKGGARIAQLSGHQHRGPYSLNKASPSKGHLGPETAQGTAPSREKCLGEKKRKKRCPVDVIGEKDKRKAGQETFPERRLPSCR